MLDLPLDDVAGALALRFRELLQAKLDLDGRPDRSQRIAQLVRQHREELVLPMIGLLQLLCRGLQGRGPLLYALLELAFSRSSARVLRNSSAKTLTLARRISGTTGTGT